MLVYITSLIKMGNDTFLISFVTQKDLWIVCIPVSILNAIFILYGLFAVIVLVVRKGICFLTTSSRKGINSNNKQTVLKTISLPDLSPKSDYSGRIGTAGSLTRNGTEVVGIYMHYVLLAALVSSVLRIISEQMIIFYAHSSYICDVLAKIDIVLTGLSIHFCHWYLWLRQHIFFSNPVLRQYRPRVFTCFSFTLCPLMLGGFFLNALIHSWYRGYTNDNMICLADNNTKLEIHTPYGMLAGSCAVVQIILTFLFVYPIIRHNAKMKDCGIPQTTKIVSRDSARRTQRQWSNVKMKSALLSRIVKKAIISCLIATTIDCLAALSFIWLPQNVPACAMSAIYEYVVIVNILCVIYTYPEWQNILFVCCGQQDYSS